MYQRPLKRSRSTFSNVSSGRVGVALHAASRTTAAATASDMRDFCNPAIRNTLNTFNK